MPEEEYEVEEGNVDRWFFVTRKRDGKEFTVSEIYYATSESTEIEVLGANNEEREEIKEAVSKYLEEKEEKEIDVKASVELLERVANKLEQRGIEPSSDVEKLRVLANTKGGMKNG